MQPVDRDPEQGNAGDGITGDARAWRPKLREEGGGGGIWPEAVPGAGRPLCRLGAGEGGTSCGGAPRGARQRAQGRRGPLPPPLRISLTSMLGKILDDWLGWAARCPELDEGDRVEVCVALKELSQGTHPGRLCWHLPVLFWEAEGP